MIDLSREGDVFVLRFDVPENRFRPDRVEAWHKALDRVEAAGQPAALVTTGSGKFYSNGLDLEWMLGEASEAERATYIPEVLGLMARVLTFPTVTVAAINGHAFGAGAQLSLAHDYRVMRDDRGYWCMPEIDMGAPLHPGMTAIIQARVSHQTAHEIIVTGTPGGTQRRAIGNDVSRLDMAASIAAAPTVNLQGALKAQAPGLTIMPNNGSVGSVISKW